MKTTVYLSRKLLNQLKVKETESKDLMRTFSTISAFTSALKRVAISPCLTRTWFAMPPV